MSKALKEASNNVGGLSSPSKMPCYSYSIPASTCNVGSKLRSVKGSVCEHCYACKGRYLFSNVQNALNRRLQSMHDLGQWTVNMIRAIALTGNDYFRWHDSGDLQSMAHLKAIVDIAIALPNVMFWLPTKEYKLVYQYRVGFGQFPTNLNVRVSAAMVGEKAPSLGLPTSVVLKDVNNVNNMNNVSLCPAPRQGGKCLDCRKCWDKDVYTVAYGKH